MTLSSQTTLNNYSQSQPQQASKYMPPQLQPFSNTAQSTTTLDNNLSSFSSQNQTVVPPFQNYFSPGLWTDSKSSSLFPFGVQSSFNAPPLQHTQQVYLIIP